MLASLGISSLKANSSSASVGYLAAGSAATKNIGHSVTEASSSYEDLENGDGDVLVGSEEKSWSGRMWGWVAGGLGSMFAPAAVGDEDFSIEDGHAIAHLEAPVFSPIVNLSEEERSDQTSHSIDVNESLPGASSSISHGSRRKRSERTNASRCVAGETEGAISPGFDFGPQESFLSRFVDAIQPRLRPIPGKVVSETYAREGLMVYSAPNWDHHWLNGAQQHNQSAFDVGYVAVIYDEAKGREPSSQDDSSSDDGWQLILRTDKVFRQGGPVSRSPVVFKLPCGEGFEGCYRAGKGGMSPRVVSRGDSLLVLMKTEMHNDESRSFSRKTYLMVFNISDIMASAGEIVVNPDSFFTGFTRICPPKPVYIVDVSCEGIGKPPIGFGEGSIHPPACSDDVLPTLMSVTPDQQKVVLAYPGKFYIRLPSSEREFFRLCHAPFLRLLIPDQVNRFSLTNGSFVDITFPFSSSPCVQAGSTFAYFNSRWLQEGLSIGNYQFLNVYKDVYSIYQSVAWNASPKRDFPYEVLSPNRLIVFRLVEAEGRISVVILQDEALDLGAKRDDPSFLDVSLLSYRNNGLLSADNSVNVSSEWLAENVFGFVHKRYPFMPGVAVTSVIVGDRALQSLCELGVQVGVKRPDADGVEVVSPPCISLSSGIMVCEANVDAPGAVVVVAPAARSSLDDAARSVHAICSRNKYGPWYSARLLPESERCGRAAEVVAISCERPLQISTRYMYLRLDLDRNFTLERDPGGKEELYNPAWTMVYRKGESDNLMIPSARLLNKLERIFYITELSHYHKGLGLFFSRNSGFCGCDVKCPKTPEVGNLAACEDDPCSCDFESRLHDAGGKNGGHGEPPTPIDEDNYLLKVVAGVAFGVSVVCLCVAIKYRDRIKRLYDVYICRKSDDPEAVFLSQPKWRSRETPENTRFEEETCSLLPAVPPKEWDLSRKRAEELLGNVMAAMLLVQEPVAAVLHGLHEMGLSRDVFSTLLDAQFPEGVMSAVKEVLADWSTYLCRTGLQPVHGNETGALDLRPHGAEGQLLAGAHVSVNNVEAAAVPLVSGSANECSDPPVSVAIVAPAESEGPTPAESEGATPECSADPPVSVAIAAPEALEGPTPAESEIKASGELANSYARELERAVCAASHPERTLLFGVRDLMLRIQAWVNKNLRACGLDSSVGICPEASSDGAQALMSDAEVAIQQQVLRSLMLAIQRVHALCKVLSSARGDETEGVHAFSGASVGSKPAVRLTFSQARHQQIRQDQAGVNRANREYDQQSKVVAQYAAGCVMTSDGDDGDPQIACDRALAMRIASGLEPVASEPSTPNLNGIEYSAMDDIQRRFETRKTLDLEDGSVYVESVPMPLRRDPFI